MNACACGFEFDAGALGVRGCPNCGGDRRAPLSVRERVARHRSAGVRVDVILSDPEAVAALEALSARLGSKKAAVSAALLALLAAPEAASGGAPGAGTKPA